MWIYELRVQNTRYCYSEWIWYCVDINDEVKRKTLGMLPWEINVMLAEYQQLLQNQRNLLWLFNRWCLGKQPPLPRPIQHHLQVISSIILYCCTYVCIPVYLTWCNTIISYASALIFIFIVIISHTNISTRVHCMRMSYELWIVWAN